MNRRLKELKVPGTQTFIVTIKRKDRKKDEVTMQLEFNLDTPDLS